MVRVCMKRAALTLPVLGLRSQGRGGAGGNAGKQLW